MRVLYLLSVLLVFGGLLGLNKGAGAASQLGEKKMLFMRTVFQDKPAVPLSNPDTKHLLDDLAAYFGAVSGGKFTLRYEFTAPLELGQNVEDYSKRGDWQTVKIETRRLAEADGYKPQDYDFQVVATNVEGMPPVVNYPGHKIIIFNGQQTLGSLFSTLLPSLTVTPAVWRSSENADILGPWPRPGGTIPFDPAGGGLLNTAEELALCPLNTFTKQELGWLQEGEVQILAGSGKYELNPHDLGNTAAGKVQAVSVPLDDGSQYWVEMRRAIKNKPSLMNSVLIYRIEAAGKPPELLDTTPQSAPGVWDSGLAAGRTFADEKAGVTITALEARPQQWSRLDETPNEAGVRPVTIVVNRGAFERNRPPKVSIAAEQEKVAVEKPAYVKVWASDEDQDALSYFWDFGDGTFASGASRLSKSWQYPGEYRVRCTVSDMKGGQTSKSVLVTVTSPTLASLRYRISGQVKWDGQPVADARVYISPDDYELTDSDGSYVFTGLPAKVYFPEVRKPGFTFEAEGFRYPVGVGPNAADVNFSGLKTPAFDFTVPPDTKALKSPGKLDALAAVSPVPGEPCS